MLQFCLYFCISKHLPTFIKCDIIIFVKETNEIRMVHAYLFLSPDETTNFYHALCFAEKLLCENNCSCEQCGECKKILARTNPDLLIYPSGKNIVVDDVAGIIEKAYESPMNGKIKIFILKNIDNATVQAQNKILKTLEEPQSNSIFLLTATNENKILQTIISRTRREYLVPLEKNELESFLLNPSNLFKAYFDFNKKYLITEVETAVSNGDGWLGKTVDALESNTLSGKLKLSKELAEDFSSSKNLAEYSAKVLGFKDELKSLFEIFQSELRKKLVSVEGEKALAYCEMIELINNSCLELERNVSANLVVDNLLMKILEIKYNYNII